VVLDRNCNASEGIGNAEKAILSRGRLTASSGKVKLSIQGESQMNTQYSSVPIVFSGGKNPAKAIQPFRFKMGSSVSHVGHGIGKIWSVDSRREAPYLVLFDSGFQDFYEEWELSAASFYTFRKVSEGALSRVDAEEIDDSEIVVVQGV
jgi:hypothetical protein